MSTCLCPPLLLRKGHYYCTSADCPCRCRVLLLLFVWFFKNKTFLQVGRSTIPQSRHMCFILEYYLSQAPEQAKINEGQISSECDYVVKLSSASSAHCFVYLACADYNKWKRNSKALFRMLCTTRDCLKRRKLNKGKNNRKILLNTSFW